MKLFNTMRSINIPIAATFISEHQHQRTLTNSGYLNVIISNEKCS